MPHLSTNGEAADGVAANGAATNGIAANGAASSEPAAEKLSPVEIAKAKSQYLRGEIPEELVDGNDFMGKDSIQLLKHHGTYQQDDRERRAEARTEGAGAKAKFFSFMVRTA